MMIKWIRYLEMLLMENKLVNLWDSVKAVLRGRLVAMQAYLKKQERSHTNNLTP